MDRTGAADEPHHLPAPLALTLGPTSTGDSRRRWVAVAVAAGQTGRSITASPTLTSPNADQRTTGRLPVDPGLA